MKVKRALASLLSACMLVSAVPISAYADSKNFSGRSEMNWSESSRGWGYVTLQKGRILKAGEGEKLEDISSGKSVFNQFSFNRGQNYYDGFSKNTALVYDTTQGDYGAYLSSGKYLYAVYDNANDRDDYKVDFAARLSGDIQQLIKKGDIEAAVVAETDNYKGTTNKQTGVANLRFYSNKSSIQQEITTPENWYDGTRTVSAGWQKLNTDITRMMLNVRSKRKGLKKFNKSSVQKIRVFLRDSVGPKAKSCGIESGDFTTYTNVNGESVVTSKIGSKIKFYVQFDEKVDITDTDKVTLRLTADPQKNTDTAKFDAKFVEVKGDKAIFEYEVPDNTNNKNGELTVLLKTAKLVGGKDYITDIAGNALIDDSVGGAFSNDKYTVDDTYTRINERAFRDNSKKFYPQISRISDTRCNTFGSIPKEIIGSNGAQPITFNASSTTGPIFRIVLDDEIQNSSDLKNMRLKLQVYDGNKNRIDGKYVYANLVGARVIGVDDKVQAKGVKSDAHTELYFRYCPTAISGYPIYRVDFAGTYNSDRSFTFADDAITTPSNVKLKNISGMEVSGSNLKVPASYTDLLPLAIGVRIDTEAPTLSQKIISDSWATKFASDASLVFEDAGGLNFTHGAKISIVYYDETGKKRNLITQLDGSNSVSGTYTLPLSRSAASKNKASVNLSGLKLLKEYPANYDLYLEYTVFDESGNVASNINQNNIRLYLDNTAPVVKGVTGIKNNRDITVKYDVTDTGVGKIDPFIEYMLKNHEKDTVENLSTEDNKQEININAVQDSYDRWQVYAKFRDILGNTGSWSESGIYETASRNLQLELNDSAESIVSDTHSALVDVIKPTDTTNAKFEVSYGWKRGSGAALADAKSTVTFTDVKSFESFDFASEAVQRQYNGGDLFDGEFTLVINTTLNPDNITQKLTRTYYFDINAPEGIIEINKDRDGVNRTYDIIYSLYDDASQYNDGAYVTENNIDFSDANAPKMTLYIGENAAKVYDINTFRASETIDFYSLFAESGIYENETKAHTEITLKDKFGHEATVRSEDFAIDLKKPEITSIAVEPSDFVKFNENTYIVNSLNDIKSITANIEDNAKDKVDLVYISGGFYRKSRLDCINGAYSYTASKPMYNDFINEYANGTTRYEYRLDVTDMGDNNTSDSVYFILDTEAPDIYFANTDGIGAMTNADSVPVELRYRHDTYETTDDITVAVSGAEIADNSEIGTLKLNVTSNGTVSVKLTDRLGKTGEKTFEVSCFDREAPKLTLDSISQTPEDGAAKYGEMVLSASDNDSLTNIGIAIVHGTPNDSDFFEDSASAKQTGGDGENPTYGENGYFNDPKGEAFASITPIHTVGSTGALAGCKLTYGAIPAGEYSVYARVSDNAGNTVTEKIADITMSAANAETSTEYTPDSSTPTGGAVTARIASDIPVMLFGGEDSDDNLTAMRANAKESRKNGYTYTYDGETHTLTLEEAIEKFKEIRTKYENGGDDLTAEDKFLVKFNPSSYEEARRYTEYLSNPLYVDPVGDLYDYIMNECMIGQVYNYETGTSDFDLDGESGYVYIENEEYYNEVRPLLMDFFERMPDDSGKADIYVPEIPNDMLIPMTFGEQGGMEFDIWSVPSEVDLSALTKSDEERTTDEFQILNPLCGKEYVSASDLLSVFGSSYADMPLTFDDETGLYLNPFGKDYVVNIPDIDKDIRAHMDNFIDGYRVTYKNPFNEHSMHENYAYGDIVTVLNALKRYQAIRESFADSVADKYAVGYMSVSGSAFSREHLLTFEKNINKTYTLMDVIGRKTPLEVRVDWIDSSRPHVPQSGIKFTVNGNEPDTKYINADSANVSVQLPDEGVYKEYRITNIPSGAVGTGESTEADGTVTYRGFSLDITDNTNVEFDVYNPSGTDTNKYRQIYGANRFDRSAPEYELTMSPKKPSDGSPVNTDVTVTLSEIKDNLTPADRITVSAAAYTFTQNGTYTFTLTDEAGNVTNIPVEVDYIDKNPTELTISFESGGNVLDTSAVFDSNYDGSDYKNVSYTYKYKGEYLKDDAEAVVSYNGSRVAVINISDGSEYTYEYTARSGSKANVSISGFKFDKEPPEAEITYVPIASVGDKKDSVRADIKISDNISASVKLISVSGRDNTGYEYSLKDIKDITDGKSLTFENNGYASLIFADDSGNTTEVRLNVTNLDRTVPRAFISYSTTAPTNSDVYANISLSKLCDYQVYSENNTLIKDYGGAYSSYITYGFEQNGNRLFRFRDMSGNVTDFLLASVSNIDKDKPQLTANVIPNKMLTEDGTLETYMAAATIELIPTSAGDTLLGRDDDTILIQNASQSVYHSVMSNGRYAFKYMDRAGNFDTLYVEVDCIDTTAPTATDSGNPTSWTNTAPTITVTPNAKASGAKTYVVQNGVRNDKIEFTPEKNGTYSFMITDEAGNSAAHKVEVKYVDLNTPIIDYSESYNGSRNIFVNAGEFDRTAFENVTASDDESGIVMQKDFTGADMYVKVEYPSDFDINVPGKYDVKFTAEDNAGNKSVLTRRVTVISPDDVYATINGEILIPNEQATYVLGEKMELAFKNADTVGSKVSYAFVKGYYNGAQMKGKSFKTLTSSDSKIKLEPDSAGLYTLFVQTENRSMTVMYVFIAG